MTLRGSDMKAETVKISVNITTRQKEAIAKLIEMGIYADQSEAVRDAINMLIEKHRDKLEL